MFNYLIMPFLFNLIYSLPSVPPPPLPTPLSINENINDIKTEPRTENQSFLNNIKNDNYQHLHQKNSHVPRKNYNDQHNHYNPLNHNDNYLGHQSQNDFNQGQQNQKDQYNYQGQKNQKDHYDYHRQSNYGKSNNHMVLKQFIPPNDIKTKIIAEDIYYCEKYLTVEITHIFVSEKNKNRECEEENLAITFKYIDEFDEIVDKIAYLSPHHTKCLSLIQEKSTCADIRR